jgi:hypothetical protein
MASIRILLLCTFAAVVYGIAHDQITARVCIEYFTVGHPPLFDTDSPTLLGLGWGIVATWWVGLLLGVGLAIAARAGISRPPRTVASLVKPVVLLMIVTGLCAFVAGLAGFALAELNVVYLVGSLRQLIPRDKHSLFLADLWAHLTSYGVGGVGGLIVMVRAWLSRRDLRSPRDSQSLITRLGQNKT